MCQLGAILDGANMKMRVTGANGFVGKTLCAELLARRISDRADWLREQVDAQ